MARGARGPPEPSTAAQPERLLKGIRGEFVRIQASDCIVAALHAFPHSEEIVMLHYAIVFLVIALIAAVLGFSGIAGAAAGIAKILFLVFLVLFVVSLIFGRGRGV